MNIEHQPFKPLLRHTDPVHPLQVESKACIWFAAAGPSLAARDGPILQLHHGQIAVGPQDDCDIRNKLVIITAQRGECIF